VFIACVLAYPDSILWTNDKNLKKIEEINIMNTSEIKTYLKTNNLT